jgi:hypothetical protein
MLYKGSQRNAAIIDELWRYVCCNKASDATLGIVESVLNRQITETKAIAGRARVVAEHFGLEVRP